MKNVKKSKYIKICYNNVLINFIAIVFGIIMAFTSIMMSAVNNIAMLVMFLCTIIYIVVIRKIIKIKKINKKLYYDENEIIIEEKVYRWENLYITFALKSKIKRKRFSNVLIYFTEKALQKEDLKSSEVDCIICLVANITNTMCLDKVFKKEFFVLDNLNECYFYNIDIFKTIIQNHNERILNCVSDNMADNHNDIKN